MRLACIDAPEMAQQPHGQRAREYLQMRLPVGAQVRLDVTTTDRFGRAATELIGGINLGLALVDTIRGSTVGRSSSSTESIPGFGWFAAVRSAPFSRTGVAAAGPYLPGWEC